MIKIKFDKKVISKLKGASQAHAGQAKDLEKDVSEEKIMGWVCTIAK